MNCLLSVSRKIDFGKSIQQFTQVVKGMYVYNICEFRKQQDL